MAQFAGPLQDWWGDLGAPALTPEVKRKIIEGVAEGAGGRSVEELARRRDEALIRVLGAVRRSS